MKNINDGRLEIVEKCVSDDGPAIVERKLNDPNHVHFTKDKILVDIYGDTYSSAPEKFCFRDGDKMLIKELVEHVRKIVDGNGVNTGLHFFKIKVKKPHKHRLPKVSSKNIQPMDDKFKIESDDIENTNNTSEMKLDLLHKVKMCWINHGADELADIGHLDDKIIHVTIENGKTYGNITCVICRDTKKKKKNDKCRVSFCSIKNYWIMSNFAKHLHDYHRLKLIRKKQNKSIVKSKSPNDADDDDSLYIIEEVEVKMDHATLEKPSEICSNEDKISLLSQFANQISKMIGVALLNDEQQEQMHFFHDKDIAELTVSKIPGDGNCLIASIAHQIFGMPINSEEHEAATFKLRQDIVKHILDSNNFDVFKYTLQDRVYEMKSKAEIVDMVEESKHFVQNVLSMNGYWGGHECVVAAQRIFSVNIITFDEDGTYYIGDDGKTIYNKTIAVAYRTCGTNGNQIMRNHYDSVTDISSENIFKTISSIEKRMNKKSEPL